jgi:hypothetical protein
MTLDTETVLAVVVVLGMALVLVIATFSRPSDYTEAQRARTRAAAEKVGHMLGTVVARVRSKR